MTLGVLPVRHNARWPMQHERFYEDATLTRTAARVVRHDDAGLVLDATVFYPLGGGQPGDTGRLSTGDGSSLPIVDTRRVTC